MHSQPGPVQWGGGREGGVPLSSLGEGEKGRKGYPSLGCDREGSGGKGVVHLSWPPYVGGKQRLLEILIFLDIYLVSSNKFQRL